MEKLSIPGAIVAGCAILAFSFYLVEMNKQVSIKEQQLAESERKDLQAKQDECESLSIGVKAKWNNVMGVTYDEGLWEECVVTFTDPNTGKIEISPLRLMETSKPK